jgi:hypothetical protein
MTLAWKSPTGAELRVTWLRVRPRPHPVRDLAHIPQQAAFVPVTQRAIVDLSGTYRLLARSVDEKVRLEAVPALAFTSLGQTTPCPTSEVEAIQWA